MATKKIVRKSKPVAKQKTVKAKRHKVKLKPLYVVVRTYSAGVHVGYMEFRQGREVELVNARRIWSWKGANTLSEISLRGVGAGSRVSEAVARIILTEAVEVIPCTPEAEANLLAAMWAP